jgi:eukaryotic-like serine/threonine-protein kinase
VQPEEVVEEQRPHPWRIAVLVLLVLAVVAAIWLLGRGEEPRYAAVPSAVGATGRVALRRLGEAGFTVSLERKRRDHVTPGTVYEQQPPGGVLGVGAIVTVLVADGPATTAVPHVTGLRAGHAARVLRAAHLRVARVPVVSSAPRGTVVSQFPRGGDRADWNAAVRINVAGDPGRLTVPDVLGRTVAAATARLRRAGIDEPQVARVASAAPEGLVVSQSPVGGSRIARSDGVRVEVSDGSGIPEGVEPENPHTPVLIGFGEREAVHELEILGYIVRVTQRRTDDPREDGTVIDQEPSGGAPRGAVITIVIGDASG